VLVDVVTCVPFSEMSTFESRLCRNKLAGATTSAAWKLVTSGRVILIGSHIQHGVGEVDIVLAVSVNFKLDG